jgi:hypothetical protein
MKMPGFTAEASLCQTSEHYHAAVTDVPSVLAAQLVAQVFTATWGTGLIPPALRCFREYVGCVTFCSRIADQSSRLQCYFDCQRYYQAGCLPAPGPAK